MNLKAFPALAALARAVVCVAALLGVSTQAGASPLNSPYPNGAERENTLYSAFFGSTPRTADPSLSFSSNETSITYNVYEPLFRYHYLKRPFTLQGLSAESVVKPVYLDKAGQPLPEDAPAEQIAESVYELRIRPGMRYAPHPAFAQTETGEPVYVPVDFSALPDVARPGDFPKTGSREVTAEDFVYAIKRLASPRVPSPAFSSLSTRIVGLSDFAARLAERDKALRQQGGQQAAWLDLRQYPLEGVTALDSNTLRIRVIGRNPQIQYWFAMTFFAPIPWEAERFYNQPGMAQRNLTLARWPVGAGPFMLDEFNLNRGYTLVRNPNYWGQPYPCEGMPGDREAGRLDDCGKPTPFLDKAVFLLEKEAVPLNGKFLQGYYDSPGLDRTEYGIAILVAAGDSEEKAALYASRDLQLPKTMDQTTWWLGFNWRDPVVGEGNTPEQHERNRKLRMAISMVIDWAEYLAIFQDGQGDAAHGPIPPGIFGHAAGAEHANREIYDVVNGQVVLKPIEAARALLAEAGYPNGRHAETGAPLVLNYESMSGTGSSPMFDWLRRAFAKLGIQLDLRATDFNRFQEKMNNGSGQIYLAGWVADYPDAENFMTLLYGPNAKANGGGENSFNYRNPEYDALYKKMVLLDDGPEKQALIDQMVDILRHDAVVMFGYTPAGAGAFQQWVGNAAPSQMIRNDLQYLKVDAKLRTEKIAEWNRPNFWPLLALIALVAAVLWGSYRTLRRQRGKDAFGRPARRQEEHQA